MLSRDRQGQTAALLRRPKRCFIGPIVADHEGAPSGELRKLQKRFDRSAFRDMGWHDFKDHSSRKNHVIAELAPQRRLPQLVFNSRTRARVRPIMYRYGASLYFNACTLHCPAESRHRRKRFGGQRFRDLDDFLAS